MKNKSPKEKLAWAIKELKTWERSGDPGLGRAIRIIVRHLSNKRKKNDPMNRNKRVRA